MRTQNCDYINNKLQDTNGKIREIKFMKLGTIKFEKSFRTRFLTIASLLSEKDKQNQALTKKEKDEVKIAIERLKTDWIFKGREILGSKFYNKKFVNSINSCCYKF